MATFEIVPNLIFVSRNDWGPNTNLPRLGGMVDRKARTHVIIHHTVTPERDATPNLWESESNIFKCMRRLQTIRPDLGFDVPYNFVAFFFGEKGLYICEGRGEDRSGAHTKGHNTAGIAVSFAGNFDDGEGGVQNIDDRVTLLSYFLGWLKHDPSHPSYGTYPAMPSLGSLRPKDRNVFFHRDFKNTACPGKFLEPYMSTVDFLAPTMHP